MSTVKDYSTFEEFVRDTYPIKPFKSDVIIGFKVAALGEAQKFVEDIRSARPERKFVEDFVVPEVDGDIPELRVISDAAQFYIRRGYSVVAMNPEIGSLRLKKDGVDYKGIASVGLDVGNRSTIRFTLEEVSRS